VEKFAYRFQMIYTMSSWLLATGMKVLTIGLSSLLLKINPDSLVSESRQLPVANNQLQSLQNPNTNT